MEELDIQEERPGVFSRLKSFFTRDGEEYTEEDVVEETRQSSPTPVYSLHHRRGYSVTVRRHVQSFQDAVAAADGLKQGNQQILNLSQCDNALREKIKDFMCGVNYAHEGSWEEVGEHVYLLAPIHATVEVAPATPRMAAANN